jgi:hypothetical protein
MLTPVRRQLLRNIAEDDGQLDRHRIKDCVETVDLCLNGKIAHISHDGEAYIVKTLAGQDERYVMPKGAVMAAVRYLTLSQYNLEELGGEG